MCTAGGALSGKIGSEGGAEWIMSGGADGAVENGVESPKDGGAASRARGHGGESKVDDNSARADVRGGVPVRSGGAGGGTCHASSGEVGEGGGEGMSAAAGSSSGAGVGGAGPAVRLHAHSIRWPHSAAHSHAPQRGGS